MSNTKTVMGQASNQYVAPTDITDVFSTYLWSGTGATQTITNGIDLAGEGGMVWAKSRNNTYKHSLYDTERGTTKNLSTNSTASEVVETGVTSFNSSGFNIGSWAGINLSGDDVASWTFRKAPKFFDVVTYTGDGASGRAIAHNLGQKPGMFVVKATSKATNWNVYHRSLGATKHIFLNLTNAEATATNKWNDTEPTSTHFTVDTHGDLNTLGSTYIAYLFAHNDGDGEFGPDADQDIIKCGSYTGNSSGVEIDLGFEPQWFMCKKTNGGSDWQIFDTMRGMHFNTTTQSVRLSPNTSGAETSQLIIGPSPTGVSIPDASDSVNISGGTYIYMAIRRGPLAQPESGTEVFAIDASPNSSFPVYEAGFPVDLGIRRYDYPSSGNSYFVGDRLRGANRLITNLTNAEASTTDVAFDSQVGWWTQPENSTSISWMWKRAPGFCDVVAYSGTGTERGVPHNLGVTPEMLIIKARDFAGKEWFVHHTGLTSWAKVLQLQSTAVETNGDTGGNLPTATTFPVNASSNVNGSGYNYIAYLFATLPGISKVGSVSHTSGSATNVDCGFTSGARFILLKVTDSSGSWFVYDTTRGIVAGNDARLKLDSTAAENTGNDDIDPLSSGFTITSTVSTGSYIFYAIA